MCSRIGGIGSPILVVSRDPHPRPLQGVSHRRERWPVVRERVEKSVCGAVDRVQPCDEGHEEASPHALPEATCAHEPRPRRGHRQLQGR